MKKALAMVMLLTLLVATFSVPAFALTGKWNAFSYEVKKNGELCITKFDWDAYGEEDVYIPKMIDGYTVTEIGSWAFSDEEKGVASREVSDYGREVSVIIPDTVTIIGDYAFFCTKIVSMNIPSSVKQIGEGAFSGCGNIRSFSVDAANTRYATIEGVLYNKVDKALINYPLPKRDKVEIPEGIKSIEPYAFFGYRSDEFINVNSTLERIEHHAFFRSEIMGLCNSEVLKNISETIGMEVGTGDLSFTEALAWAIEAGMEIDESYYYADNGNVLMFPSSLKFIGESAFEDVKCGMGSFDILDLSHTQLTSIEDNTFCNTAFPEYGCKILLPSTLKTIDTAAFKSDKRHAWIELDFSDEPHLAEIGDNAFEGCNLFTSSNDQYRVFALPSSLSTIGSNAFFTEGVSYVLSIPSSVTAIGENICDRTTVDIDAAQGTYAYFYATQNGYTLHKETENTDWLSDNSEKEGEEDTSWLDN